MGGREYIGNPKQPTITICTLKNDKYEKQLFQGNIQLISPTFTTLKLTANQVFNAAQ
jgi:Uma2 family endonuclease